MAAQDNIDDVQDSLNINSEKIHSMETRLQTIAMVLIVGFLTWVGTGLVDVKVGLAQVLSESVSLRSALDIQSRRLTRIENEVIDINKEMSNYITRDEFREELRDLRDIHDKD